MIWSFGQQRQSKRRAALGRLFAFGLPLAAAGCALGHDVSGTEVGQVDGELAALMADGKLPPEMQPPVNMPPEPPPRFCSFPTFPEPDQDGGVAEPPIGKPPIMAPGLPGAAGSPAGGGGMAGTGAADGGIEGGGVDPACASVPMGFWTFDDCNPQRSELFDSSFENHVAFRNVDLKCAAGRQGMAPSFAAPEDLVYVPDQAGFALDAGVTVAAWVKPEQLDRVRTLFRKRDDTDSAFALVINQGKFQFVVRLKSGRLASVSAPAVANRWTHVAATYDGQYLRLYLDGAEVKRTYAVGSLIRGLGPLLMGNDASARRFRGRLDNAWFNTMAAPPETIRELTCLRQDPTVSVTPLIGPAVPAGTPVTFTLSIASKDGPTCSPASFGVSPSPSQQDFTVDPQFTNITVATGETMNIPFKVSSGPETEAGNYPISFFVFSNNNGPFGPIGVPGGGPVFVSGPGVGFASASRGPTPLPTAGSVAPPVEEPVPPTPTGFTQVTADYVVAEPPGCHVTSQRELMIRHLSVVEDPVRTNPSTGAWSFNRLMQDLSPTAADAPALTEAMFSSFLTPQVVNSFTIPVRPPMQDLVLGSWPRTADGKLDLARAPVRLLAITNRIDLKDLAKGKAGEGRFTFGVLSPDGFQMEFTVIFEYAMPAKDEAEARVWADDIHALQALPFPSEEYNAALQALTERFSGRGIVPSMPNGSALIDIRTNEIALSLDGQWQLREFHLSPLTGGLDPAALFQTPDRSFDGTPALARFINENETAILAETHEAPAFFEDAPFQAASVFNNIDFWNAPGITNPEARHKFSLNTCSGCHGQETQTAFLQIFPREPGQQSTLSGFLTGTTVFDPVSGQQRTLNELGRRRKLLESVVCTDEP